MSSALELAIAKQRIEGVSPEESATYGLFTLCAQRAYLTEGVDYYTKDDPSTRGYRAGPLVPGYYLAQWLAWHWWRHRWEPRRQDKNWPLAHSMSAVGEGYVWPDITVLSDGYRMMLSAKPSREVAAKPFRYTQSLAVAVLATEWEVAVDGFFQQVLGHLEADGLKATELHQLVEDLRAERADSELARFRRIEALLGRDPDILDETSINQLIKESALLGADAVDEMAAHAGDQANGDPAWVSAQALDEYLRRDGFSASLRDGVTMTPPPLDTHKPAWVWGAAAAKQLRQQEGLSDNPIKDGRLAALLGVEAPSLQSSEGHASHPALALERSDGGDRIALRAKHGNGRRFELARLLADRFFSPQDRLHPATSSYTYRQQAQRAFAGELLCPADVVISQLQGNYEEEDRWEDLAEAFSVSALVVKAHLVNNQKLDRDELEDPDRIVGVA